MFLKRGARYGKGGGGDCGGPWGFGDWVGRRGSLRIGRSGLWGGGDGVKGIGMSNLSEVAWGMVMEVRVGVGWAGVSRECGGRGPSV